MNKEILSAEKYADKKAEALQLEPMTKKVSLNSIELSDDSYESGYIKVDGNNVAVEKSFFKGLSKLLNVNATLQNSLVGKKSSGKEGGGILYTKMIDALKSFKSHNKPTQVLLVANQGSSSITNILSEDYSRITNNGLFNIVERLVNDYPQLGVIDVNSSGGGLGAGVKLLASTDFEFGNMRGTEDETFRFGMNIENRGINTLIGDFAYRMVCQNGMMGMKTINNFKLEGLGDRDIKALFDHIVEVERRNFMPCEFKENMELAAKVPASFREVESAFDKTKKLLSLKPEETDLKGSYNAALAEKYFWGYPKTQQRLLSKGVELKSITDKQKSFINSGMNMWDLINTITFLGSNKTGMPFKNQDELQKIGGKQFHAEYDLAYADLMNI